MQKMTARICQNADGTARIFLDDTELTFVTAYKVESSAGDQARITVSLIVASVNQEQEGSRPLPD
jgi:hypothetical protein